MRGARDVSRRDVKYDLRATSLQEDGRAFFYPPNPDKNVSLAKRKNLRRRTFFL